MEVWEDMTASELALIISQRQGLQEWEIALFGIKLVYHAKDADQGILTLTLTLTTKALTLVLALVLALALNLNHLM